MSNFQLACGYSLSILKMPSKLVPKTLLDDHKNTAAARAVDNLLWSDEHPTVKSEMYSESRDAYWWTVEYLAS